MFSGTVSKLRSIDPGPPPWNSAVVAATFQIETLFKGLSGNEISVFTSASSAACGYAFEAGLSYLVYANRDQGVLFTTTCSRTRPLAQAGEDVTDLYAGAGSAPGWLITRSDTGRARIHLADVENRNVTIEASNDLVSWTPVAHIASAAMYVFVDDTESGAAPARFYRATTTSSFTEGLFGQVVAFPGACLEDPENPGEPGPMPERSVSRFGFIRGSSFCGSTGPWLQ